MICLTGRSDITFLDIRSVRAFNPQQARTGFVPASHGPAVMSLCPAALSCIGLLLGLEACGSPPPWSLPPGLSSGARVRVISPRLGKAWQPGRVVFSSAGCWVIEAVPTYDPKNITVLRPGELTRLQLSKA